MIKTIALIVVGLLAVLIAVVLILALTKPDTFRVERTTSIKAPPEKIFPLLNDFQSWSAWSPYEKKDPAMKRTFSGPPSGKGAIYEWDGDKNVGQGRMEIMRSTPPSNVTLDLDFVKPFEAHNTVVFTLAPQGDFTTVTWAMQGPANFISKVMQVFINMDKMVGTDFEAGLANLKALAEK
jgi:uncharacterized protein YndB with AHSA1/START domain